MEEEKELKNITKSFEDALGIFKKKDYKNAIGKFQAIVETYKDSEYYSVLEIQTRSKVYQNIANSFLNPVKVELKGDEDYLSEGLFNLNSGNPDKALELLAKIESKNKSDAYIKYLMALAHLKKEDTEKCMEYLEQAIKLDAYYKVIAHNEPDFDSFQEDEKFEAIIS